MIDKFPIIKLEGDSTEIGIQHGKALKERISSSLQWYKEIFGKEDDRILSQAEFFKKKIKDFEDDFCAEIEGIASGAGIDDLWIYALNARSEIMNFFRNECTAVYFRKTSILGQNWDWAKKLEDLAVFCSIKKNNGTKIFTMTEPGMIGKIGCNNHGIGVCLNFLDSGKQCIGVPVHALLRKIMEAESIKDAKDSIVNFTDGLSANILIGDENGKLVNLEFAVDDVYDITGKYIFIHTNHYLGNMKLNADREKLASSFSRFNRGMELSKIAGRGTIDEMKSILLDKQGSLPICRHYVDSPDIGIVGTVCTMIMDLPNREVHITRGSPLSATFERIEPF